MNSRRRNLREKTSRYPTTPTGLNNADKPDKHFSHTLLVPAGRSVIAQHFECCKIGDSLPISLGTMERILPLSRLCFPAALLPTEQTVQAALQ